MRALWDGWAVRSDMARRLSGAWARLSALPENKAWSDIRGPASALVGTMMRIGWKLLDPFR
eukprot:1758107-Pyramimonas_sp.AAC.1